MKTTIYLSTAYHAPVQYYAYLLYAKEVLVEQYETYQKQTYRNRCLIATQTGALALSVPVEYSASQKTKTKDVRISEHGNWQHTHWNALIATYNSSPFFEHYSPYFEPFYTKKYEFLMDFNQELIQTTLSLLKIKDKKISRTESFQLNLEADVLDLRNTISPKIDWHADPHFMPKPYYQVFDQHKESFQANMSILDLLFNMGNESSLVLRSLIKDL